MISNNELLNELKLKLSELEDSKELVHKQNQELKKVNENLADSELLKSHFISNITNEIVNPFASILGLSKNIIAAKEIDQKKIRKMAELIHSEAFELDFQLRNIFSAAKIEAGEAEPDFIKSDIHLLLLSLVESYKYKAEQKQLNIKFNFDIGKNLKENQYFVTDPEKLKLIISNILSNSIKYSNAASKIEIKGWIEDSNLKIMIKDYGIGIEKSDLDSIFDRFKRLDDTIHSLNPGHGLGLSITKALIDVLNGNIDIVSKRGIGSVFTITLPKGENTNSEDFAIDGNEFIFDDDNGIF